MSQKNKPEAAPAGAVADDVVTVDARGMRCPMPLLRAKQALNNLVSGERVRVLATDSGSVRDFHSYAELSGHKIEFFAENQGQYEYLLVKKREDS